MTKDDKQKRLGPISSDQPRERVAREVPDFASDQIARLRAVFPEAFTEGRVDIAKLRASLGEPVDTGAERFVFSWAGRSGRRLQSPQER